MRSPSCKRDVPGWCRPRRQQNEGVRVGRMGGLVGSRGYDERLRVAIGRLQPQFKL